MSKRLLFLAGSTRHGSYNQLLAKAAMTIAIKYGAEVEWINLSDYTMPLFNEDLEAAEGLPETAKQLKQKFISADGFFIVSPEYNSSIPPVLKNSLDWISRQDPFAEQPEPRLAAFADKAAAIASASPGALGGIRVLVPLRLLLANLGVNVVGQQLALPTANQAFDSDNQLISPFHLSMLEAIIQTLIRIS